LEIKLEKIRKLKPLYLGKSLLKILEEGDHWGFGGWGRSAVLRRRSLLVSRINLERKKEKKMVL